MKKNTSKAFALSALAAASMLPVGSQASDGTITLTGNVLMNTCTITGDGDNYGTNFSSIVLPNPKPSALSYVGAMSGITPFNLRLSNCNPSAGKVRMEFKNGPSVNVVTGRLKNTNTTNPATNVELAILNADDTAIKVGAPKAEQNSQIVSVNAGAARLRYSVVYVATDGPTTIGSFSTNVTYALDWQ